MAKPYYFCKPVISGKVNERLGGFFQKFLIIAALFLLPGCTGEDLCEDITGNPLRIIFYIMDEGQPVQASIDSLTVSGLGKDTLIYDNSYNVGRINVQMDQSSDSCGYVLHFPGNVDTLKFYYERNLTLVSIECGFVTFFEINEVDITTNIIESYTIEQDNITNVNEEHIRIILPGEPGGDASAAR